MVEFTVHQGSNKNGATFGHNSEVDGTYVFHTFTKKEAGALAKAIIDVWPDALHQERST